MFLNSNLFEPGKSKPERSFLQAAVKQNSRFDGRRINEFRDVELTFGSDWGIVAVLLGQTKVLAQVSCEIGPPNAGRLHEGTLHLNVETEGISFINEVQTTRDQRFLTLNSLLERTFRSSHCLDLESLCVAAELHVWCVRVSISILNNDGNLYDACTVAALAALMHYRRPEVTYIDGQIRIYSEKERELVPLLFLHYPVSVSYCVFKSSPQPLADPTLLEENASNSIIVLSFNSYNELCSLNAGGTAPTNARVIMQCARYAARRCKQLVQFMRKAMALDEQQRLAKQVPGLLALISEAGPKLTFNRLMAEELAELQRGEEPKGEPADSVEQATVATCAEPPVATSDEPPAKPKDDSIWLPAADTQMQSDMKRLSLKQSAQTPPKPSTYSKTTATPNRGKGKANQRPPKQSKSDSEEDIKPVI